MAFLGTMDSVNEKPSCFLLLLPPQNTSGAGGREGRREIIAPNRTDLVQVPTGTHGGQERSLPRWRALRGGTKELRYRFYRDFAAYLQSRDGASQTHLTAWCLILQLISERERRSRVRLS